MEAETMTPCAFMFTLPQMPLSEIDGMVNLISEWRAKERHLIFDAFGGTARRGVKFSSKIKFSRGQISSSVGAHQHCKMESQ